MTGHPGIAGFDRLNGAKSDICLIVEGCYPHIAGGVSTWVDWLIRSQPDLTFSVMSIVAGGEPRTAKFRFPDNLVAFQEIVLGGAVEDQPRRRKSRWPWSSSATIADPQALATALSEFILSGRLGALERLYRFVESEDLSLGDLIASRDTFAVIAETYRLLMPYGIFEDFYWAWHSLMGGLFTVLKAPLIPARTYHAISTGYAGLVLARAKLDGAAHTIITEHGIYTNERRIELLMADWLIDTIDNGYRLDRDRLDLRDLWIRAFESYARACYEGADDITTLFADNQPMQRALGAAADRLAVIPNGIDFERFAAIPWPDADEPPTVALIGRVVPIKDVKTFISAVAQLKRRLPELRAYVAGPTDEDEAYAEECMALAKQLGLEGTLTFTGRVNVTELLRRVHVMALTSLSEAQPLTVLEAGAAGRPCVTTNVGACREMLEGSSDEAPAIGQGGLVTDILNAEQIAAALWQLLSNLDVARETGQRLQTRVERYYTTPTSRQRYRDLYGFAGAGALT
jgi:glycosyltransferase involved in cell wall biosynthesis